MKILKQYLLLIILILPIHIYSQPGYENGIIDNNGVGIHYVTKGKGNVIIFLHGFPDFWYTWKYQMDKFSENYKVVGIDLRGYNKSDKPKGVESYKMSSLIADVVSVIDHFSKNGATIIANDWGGAIGWYVAMYYPDKVNAFIACNIPHPTVFKNYLNKNPSTGNYTSDLIADDALKNYTPDRLIEVANVPDSLRSIYKEAFQRTDIGAILNYYKANYPKPTKQSNRSNEENPINQQIQNKLKCKVLMIHGMKDKAFPSGTLNGNWEYTDEDFTLFTIKNGGHFIQREKPELVYRIIKLWLELNS